MLPRPQKPSLRDFMLMHARTRAHLCSDDEIFDPCVELKYLTSFEKATLTSWAADSNVDKGLNMYILLHCLSSINDNSYYYHYVNNGNPDGTNMFGHIIGTSGLYMLYVFIFFKLSIHNMIDSGKSSALTPHIDALARALVQLDINHNYIQYPNKNNDLSLEQPFIISNVCFAFKICYVFCYFNLITGHSTTCLSEFDLWKSFIMLDRVRYTFVEFRCLW